jgi:hypothetical protein
MSYQDRVELYREMESLRGRPLVVYMTSSRGNAGGRMAGDAVPEFMTQLEALPPGAGALDLLVVSQGGDPTVAWRVVSLIRERVEKLAVLVPEAAFSAATMIALGADEIVMHPNGNLGPVDPQIELPGKTPNDQGQRFGSEDLLAYLHFCRERVGLTDQVTMIEAFKMLSQAVGPVPIGVAARSSQLSVSMGEKLLRLHMKEPTQAQKARTLAETLNKQFFHHGYPVSRTEAKEIGLQIAERDADVENLMWRIWTDIEGELKLREPFNPMAVLAGDPSCAPLFAPVPQIQAPANLPPQLQQQVLQQILQQVGVASVGPTDFSNVQALMESSRAGSRFVTEGQLFACRLPDLQIKLSVVQKQVGWRALPPPQSPALGAP